MKTLVERERLKSDIVFTRGMLETDIERHGACSSYMIRAGLLLDILDRVKALEAALGPFSDALGDVAADDPVRWPDDQTIEHDGFPEFITVGHLRTARTTLKDTSHG